MRILHTADWHLGKRLDTFSRLDEQKEVLQEICEIAEREMADAVVIAGDLFDTFNPPSEAVELFYKTVKRLSNNGKRLVLALAGNHDSPDRIEAPDPLGRECGIIFAGYPNSIIQIGQIESGICITQSDEGFVEIKLPMYAYSLRIIFTPYANEFRLKTFIAAESADDDYRSILRNKWEKLAAQYCDNKGVNILAAHLYFMKKGEVPPEEPEDEKPILHVGGAQAIFSEDVPKQIQYVALGHLHRRHTIDKDPCPIVYCSSPLPYSFGESNQDKYVVMLEAEPDQKVKYRAIRLEKGKRLLRKTFDQIEKAIEWLKENPEALIELTIITDKFLSSEEKKILFQTHPGIINIIPEIKDKAYLERNDCKPVDLNKSTEELFKEYFKFKYGNLPNDRIVDLFKEAQAENMEEV